MILKDDYTRDKLFYDKVRFRLLKELKKVYSEFRKQKDVIKMEKARDEIRRIIKSLTK